MAQKSAAKSLTDVIIKALKEKKGQNIVRMDLRNLSGAIVDYFVICTGTSDRHVSSLAETVVEKVKETLNEKPISKEGLRVGEWVLLDYVNVIVHVFQEEKRAFYAIEDLWGDAEIEEIKAARPRLTKTK